MIYKHNNILINTNTGCPMLRIPAGYIIPVRAGDKIESCGVIRIMLRDGVYKLVDLSIFNELGD